MKSHAREGVTFKRIPALHHRNRKDRSDSNVIVPSPRILGRGPHDLRRNEWTLGNLTEQSQIVVPLNARESALATAHKSILHRRQEFERGIRNPAALPHHDVSTPNLQSPARIGQNGWKKSHRRNFSYLLRVVTSIW